MSDFVKNFKSFYPMIGGDNTRLAGLDEVSDVPLDFVIAEGYQQSTIGLVKFQDEGKYVLQVGEDLEVITVGQSVKKVNKKKVKRLLATKIEELRAQHEIENPMVEFFLDKQTKKDLEADIVFELLPETEADDFYNTVVMDKSTNILYVLNGTKKITETITSYLRRALGSFATIGFDSQADVIVEGFNNLLQSHESDRLSLGNYIKLKDEEGTVVWSKESLQLTKAQELNEDGKNVVAIGLEYDAFVDFIIDTNFHVKGLKWPKDMSDDESSFEADLMLVFKEVKGLMSDMIAATIKEDTSKDINL